MGITSPFVTSLVGFVTSPMNLYNQVLKSVLGYLFLFPDQAFEIP